MEGAEAAGEGRESGEARGEERWLRRERREGADSGDAPAAAPKGREGGTEPAGHTKPAGSGARRAGGGGAGRMGGYK